MFQNTANQIEYFATETQIALQYFYLNPTTGEISARQSLRNDNSLGNNVYRVGDR